MQQKTVSSLAHLQRIFRTTSDKSGALIRELIAEQESVALLSEDVARKVWMFCPSLGCPIGLLSLKSDSVGGGFPPLALHTAVIRSPVAIFGEIFPSTSMERAGRDVGPELVSKNALSWSYIWLVSQDQLNQ